MVVMPICEVVCEGLISNVGETRDNHFVIGWLISSNEPIFLALHLLALLFLSVRPGQRCSSSGWNDPKPAQDSISARFIWRQSRDRFLGGRATAAREAFLQQVGDEVCRSHLRGDGSGLIQCLQKRVPAHTGGKSSRDWQSRAGWLVWCCFLSSPSFKGGVPLSPPWFGEGAETDNLPA